MDPWDDDDILIFPGKKRKDMIKQYCRAQVYICVSEKTFGAGKRRLRKRVSFASRKERTFVGPTFFENRLWICCA